MGVYNLGVAGNNAMAKKQPKADLGSHKVDNLFLDPKNPRLPEFVGRSPEEIEQYLIESASVDELVSAIGENGYFASEPLIGVEEDGQLIIVEGNRRLTALKVLRFGATKDKKAIAALPAKVRDALSHAEEFPEEVPVAVYPKRADVLVYLGNKHIAGVRPWGALAKAKYVDQLMEAFGNQKDYSERVRDVARSIGSRSDYINRSIRALQAYNDAVDNKYFGLPGLSEETVKFSRLSSALDYSDILLFATGGEKAEYPVRYDPSRLEELMGWLFVKDEKGQTVLGDTRNLSVLKEVIINDEALHALRSGKSLSNAYRLTSALEDDYDQAVSRAYEALQEASSLVVEVEATEARLDDINRVFKHVRSIRRTLEDEA